MFPLLRPFTFFWVCSLCLVIWTSIDWMFFDFTWLACLFCFILENTYILFRVNPALLPCLPACGSTTTRILWPQSFKIRLHSLTYDPNEDKKYGKQMDGLDPIITVWNVTQFLYWVVKCTMAVSHPWLDKFHFIFEVFKILQKSLLYLYI